ncbi:hypothetical protein MACH26_31210 [Planctobacterium marinum]|uniref:Cadherin domain-containing protein n=1 Tax=Planctobacterium marinum TaxID=1631968 RepID=A0AA48HZQ0_9ALTE|nr:hypothetical protein MACH26_31210 [Planctobacterium marinum]
MDASDFTVTNGSAANLSGSGDTYTVNITPSADGDVTVTLPANAVSDAVDSSVQNPESNTLTIDYSATPSTVTPTLSISSASASLTSGGPITYTVTYSNADLVNLATSHVTLNKTGTADATVSVTGSGVTERTVSLSNISGDGTLGISIAAVTARHESGGTSEAAGPSGTFSVDNTSPTVTITDSVADSINAAFTATFTFSEDVTGFAESDITATNASLSDFAITSASVYTATVTPTADGSVTLDVAASVATDSASNGNTAATQYSVNYDTTAPTIDITGPTTSQNAAFTATFTFSEDVTGFAESDITATNASLSDFASTSASVYTATVTPSSEGSVTLDVAASVATDSASNGNTAATQYSVDYDATAPTIDITGPTTSQNAAFTATFTFSEDVTGFVESDITATNASLSDFASTSASVYTATVTPTADGSVTLDVAASVATDSASNGNTAATQYSVDYDATAPTIDITGPTTSQNAAFTATFTFSEDVTGFAESDITATNASLSDFASTSASVYTATVTPTADGSVTLDVAASAATDSASNGNTAATQYSVNYDTTAPTIDITGPTTSQNAAFTATFTFSEDVTGFAESDITATNASLSDFASTSASVYTATVTPSSEGSVTLDVAASVATDSASNGNTAATQYSVDYDATAPTIDITGPTTSQNAAFTATFTFSEDVTGFVESDITATNASLSDFASTSASVYTATVTPTADGSVTLDVAASVATDSASNGNTAATQYSVDYDATAPTIDITGPTTSQNAAFTATFTFSEDVTGFAESDITATNASLSDFASTSASVYTATVTPTADGSVTLDVAASAATDSASNGNTAATQYSVNYDTTAPTIDITGPTTSQNAAFTATFTFSEDVTGFAESDITATNASLSDFASTSASVYTATVTPSSEGSVTLDVAASVATDSASNGNTAATQYSVNYDTTAPTIDITGPTTSQNAAFTATFTFSEDVTGFVESDITATNASLSDFASTSASVYTATVTPTADGSVTLDVAASVATDSASNGNTAATQYSVDYDATAPTIDITGPTTSQNAAFTATFTFSEDVTGFAESDITATNASLSDFASTSASVYTATVTPTADGSVTLDVAASVATDSASNGNTAATQYSVNYDTTAPTIDITGPTTSQNAAFTATFTFSEDVTGFAESDITATNASLSDFVSTSASVYTATVTPSSEGNVTLDVAASAATDSASNGNTAATQYTVNYDVTAPTLSSSSPSDDSTLVQVDTDLVLEFSESIYFNSSSSGTLEVIRLSDSNSELENITLTLNAGELSGQGSATISDATLTINLNENLKAGGSYAIRMSSDLLNDEAGNAYDGISSLTALNFNTIPALILLVDTTQLIEEKEETATVTVALRNAEGQALNASSSVTVNLSFTGSTATNGDDFNVSGITNNALTISAGNSESSFTITSINDSPLADEPEQVLVAIDNIPSANALEETTQQITVNIVENAVPEVTNLPTQFTIQEDTKTNLALSDVVISDSEGDSVQLNFVVSEGDILSPLGSVSGVVVTQVDTQTLQLAGTAAEINSFLDDSNAIALIPLANSNSQFNLSLTVTDGTETSAAATVAINITAVNDAPELINGQSIGFDMSGGTIPSVTAYTETESGITMTVSLDAGNLTVADLQTLGGTEGNVLYSNGSAVTNDMSVTFSEEVNLASLQLFFAAGTEPQTMTFTPLGGTGTSFTVPASKFAIDNVGSKIDFDGWNGVTGMTVTSVESAFSVGIDSLVVSKASTDISVTEDISFALDMSSLTISDADSTLLNLELTVPSGNLSLLNSSTSGSSISTTSNGLSVSGTATQINLFLNETGIVLYTPAENANGENLTAISLSVNDNDGSAALVRQVIGVNVSAVNDAPVVTNLNGDSVNFTQGTSSVRIDANNDAALSDVDDTDFDGGQLIVSVTSGGVSADDLISLQSGLLDKSAGASVTVDNITVGTLVNAIGVGNDLVVNLNANANADRVSRLLQAVTYFNNNTIDSVFTARQISVQVSDGEDVSASSLVTVTFTPLDRDSSFTFDVPFTRITSEALSQSTAQTAVVIDINDSGSDGVNTVITGINFAVTGTLNADNMSFSLREVNESNATTIATYFGVYANGILSFDDTINIANGSSNIQLYLEAWFNDTAPLVDNSNISFSITPTVQVSVSETGSQIGTSTTQQPVTLTLDIEATQLLYSRQPEGVVSGNGFAVTPLVAATDRHGLLDTDFNEAILLSVSGPGLLTGNTAAAAAGIASFDGLSYAATEDNELILLTASSGALETVTSDNIVSQVIATNIRFDVQPAPLLVNAGSVTQFTTAPSLSAVNGQGVLDTDFFEEVALQVTNASGSAQLAGLGDLDDSSDTVTLNFDSGVVTFESLQITYETQSEIDESFNLLVTSNGLSQALSEEITVNTGPVLEGLSSELSVTEDVLSNIDLSNLVLTSSQAQSIVMTLTVNSGALSAAAGDGTIDQVQITGSGSSTLILQGAITDISALLTDVEAIQYMTALNDDSEDSLIISVSDGSLESVGTAVLSIVAVNDAPVISGDADTSVLQGAEYQFGAIASDIDSDNLVFAIANQPSWTDFNVESGVLSGVPGAQDVGLNEDIVISVSDGELSAQLPAFSIEVISTNSAPVAEDQTVTAIEDTAINIGLSASDAEGNELEYSIVTTATAGVVQLNGAVVTYLPNADVSGVTDTFTFVANDGQFESNIATVTIEITPVNDAPEISGEPQVSVATGSEYLFEPNASDIDSEQLLFSISGQPLWSSFDTQTGRLSGSPLTEDIGLYTDIVISVSDGEVSSSLSAFTIEVFSDGTAPVAQDQTATVAEDNTIQVTLVASDIDNDNLTYRIIETTNSGVLQLVDNVAQYTPQQDISGVTDSFTFVANDGEFDSNIATVTISITPVNDAPLISGVPATRIKVLKTYNFAPQVTDVDSESLTFSIENRPDWANFANNTGVLSGTPSTEDAGVYGGVKIIVSDGELSAELPAFDIEVLVNSAPELLGTPDVVVQVGEAYQFTPQATDPDGDELRFSINNLPTWAAFDTTNGALTGSPASNDVGTFTGIIISVTDGVNTVSLPAFSIRVCEVCENIAPEISGVPASSVTAGGAYEFTPVATDENNDVLQFSIANIPNWASFDPTTGRLAGTPAQSDVGLYRNIVITVSDGQDSVSLSAFSVEVLSSNSAPTISGNPATTAASGVQYSFTPSASDVDGDDLLFSIVNKPSWASFNPNSGRLRGTPVKDDAGLFTDIVIRVTDGVNDVVALPEFTIEVTSQNSAPVITGTPRTTVTQGTVYLFSPSASDADGDALTFSVSNLPDWLALNEQTGSITGTPQEEDVGDYTNIELSVSDGNEQTSLPSFAISVVSSNTAPVATNSEVSTSEDKSVTIIANAVDENQDELTFTIINPPLNGTLNTTDSGWVYNPSANFNGVDSFDYSVSDGELTSEQATVTVNVTAVNDKPEAVNDEITLDQLESGIYTLDVLANDIDPDIATNGDVLSLQRVSANLGTAQITDNQLEVNLGTTFIGTVNLTYSIRDAEAKNDTARVSLTISGVADINAPIITVPEDVTVEATGLITQVNPGTASAIDAEGNQLPVTLLDPNLNFAPGVHTLYWQAEDSFGSVSTEEQRITVLPIISLASAEATAEGTTVEVEFLLNGDAPSYPYAVSYTLSGTAEGNGVDYTGGAGTVTFTEGQLAKESFDVHIDSEIEIDETIIVSLDEGQNIGANSTATITISEDNIAPTITLTVLQDSIPTFVVAQDEGQTIVMAEVADPNPQDSLSLDWTAEGIDIFSTTGDSFEFDPSVLDTGRYEVSLYVNDDGEPILDATESVVFEIVTSRSELSETEDTDGDLIPDAQEGYGDSDGDGIPDYLDAIDDCNVIASQAQEQSQFLVESEPGVCMRVGDTASQNDSNGVQVVVDNNAPRQSRTNQYGERVELLANDLPEDRNYENVGGIFDFVLYDLQTAGQVVRVVMPQSQPIPENAVYRKYNPSTELWRSFVSNDNNKVFSAPGAEGNCPPPGAANYKAGLTADHWCVQLLINDGGPNDQDGAANAAIADPGGVAIFISDNTKPVAADDNIQMSWNSEVEIDVLRNDSDADGDQLSIRSAEANIGIVEIRSDRLLYIARAGYAGRDTISYAIGDGNGGRANAKVVLEIRGNRAPGASDDFAETDNLTPIVIDVLANDIDVDGDEISVVSAVANSGSVVVLADNQIQYTPELSFSGLDIVTYEVVDTNGATAIATVSVFVDGNESPVAASDSVVTEYETSVTVDVILNDSDPDGDALMVIAAQANNGRVVVNDDNTITYTPEAGFSGTDIISYTITDGALEASSQVTVTVNPEPVEVVKVTGSSGGSLTLWWLLLSLLLLGYRSALSGKRAKIGIKFMS